VFGESAARNSEGSWLVSVWSSTTKELNAELVETCTQ
jgi:hypothetical protein